MTRNSRPGKISVDRFNFDFVALTAIEFARNLLE
jgi:hypothetical protein